MPLARFIKSNGQMIADLGRLRSINKTANKDQRSSDWTYSGLQTFTYASPKEHRLGDLNPAFNGSSRTINVGHAFSSRLQ